MSAMPLCAPLGTPAASSPGPVSSPVSGPGTESEPLGPFLHVHAPGSTAPEGAPVPYPAYRPHLEDLARRRRPLAEALGELVVHGARSAAGRLREDRRAAGGAGGQVCAAVPVSLAHDPVAVLAGARAVHRAVDRPDLMITVPATARGLEAITGCLSEGIGVHAVCVVSVEGYARVLDAFLSGLEGAARAGLDLGAVPTALSLAVAGLDSAAGGARAASERDTEGRLRAGLAAATVEMALRIREQVHAGTRWRALARQGARPHPLWWDGIRLPGGRGAARDDSQVWRVLDAPAEQGICYRQLTARAQAQALAGSARRQRHTAQRLQAALHAAGRPEPGK